MPSKLGPAIVKIGRPSCFCWAMLHRVTDLARIKQPSTKKKKFTPKLKTLKLSYIKVPTFLYRSN
jgi:hypothetical protein